MTLTASLSEETSCMETDARTVGPFHLSLVSEWEEEEQAESATKPAMAAAIQRFSFNIVWHCRRECGECERLRKSHYRFEQFGKHFFGIQIIFSDFAGGSAVARVTFGNGIKG